MASPDDRAPAFHQRALEGSTVAMVVVCGDAVVAHHTPWAARMLRGPGADFTGELFPRLFDPEVRENVDGFLRRLADEAAQHPTFMEASCTLTDGDQRWLEITGVNMLGVPEVSGLVLNLADRTEHRRELAEAGRIALTDALTGLENRRALEGRLVQDDPKTLLVIDLDNFKAVNDTWGHRAGDDLLAAVGRRLQNVVPASGSVYRLAGDEFVVVVPHADVPQGLTVATNVLAAVRGNGRAPATTASVGIARSVSGDGGASTLRRADAALYSAKRCGPGTFVLADDEDEQSDWEQQRRDERIALEEAMRNGARLKADVETLRVQNRADERTGLLNQAAFDADIVQIDERARRVGRPCAIVLCDVDYFKEFNQRYLYSNANVVLREVAKALTSACRPDDVVYRYGGDEFAVVLLDTDLREAAVVGERLRCAVETLGIAHENRPPPHHVTISVGVAVLDVERDRTWQDFLDAANRRLKEAEGGGKNRVES